MIKNNMQLKDLLIRKESILLWFILIFSIFINFYDYINSNQKYDLNLYTRMSVLFDFAIVIIIYVFFISIYLKYVNHNILIRYKFIASFKKKVIIDIIIFTIIFVVILNLSIFVITNKILVINYDDINYLIFLVMFQFLSFLFLGLLYLIIYFKTFKSSKSLVVSFSIYLLSNAFIISVHEFFILPYTANNSYIMIMIRKIISIYCILLIYLTISKDKGNDVYL